MIRRRFLLQLSIAMSGVIASGCQSMRRRKETDEDEESALPKEARDQHKSTRLPGAWSSEGNAIERDLGVR
jgi:hypothetical protein